MRVCALLFAALSLLALPPLVGAAEKSEKNEKKAPSAAPAVATDSASDLAPGAEYRIGIEDVLRVSVWGEPSLDTRVRVRPDGKISLPLTNEISVEGLTPEEIRREVSTRLAKLIRDPTVSVIVEEINSFRVYVLGEVAHQGAMTFSRPIRLLQAIASAGGLTPYSKKEIVLLRDVNGTEQRLHIDYERLLAGHPTASNLYLRPGDTILVE
jgi:polysaccharide biosynthesis/export protein